MFSPTLVTKSDFALIAAALAAVVVSGLVMDAPPSLANNSATHEIVGQAAIAPQASPSAPAITAQACDLSLDLMDAGGGLVDAVLTAPCLPNQDVVIAHAGLVFSGQTMATGTLLFQLPALKSPALVDVRFSSGDTAQAAIDMPEAVNLQRIAVQWAFEDGFDLHAFHNDAAFGAQGHMWRQSADKGSLMMLGDAGADVPLMAQVFTYSQESPTDVLLEAAVTPSSCGQELMGDILFATSGDVQKTELTLAMPDCAAIGQFVHIGNLAPSTNLAMAR
jgi:hypothetical protein